MPTHFHAAVWLDHTEAKVFHIGLTGADDVALHPQHPTRHLHHKANSIGSGHTVTDKHFLEDIAGALSDAGEILIVGPGGARTELARYLQEKHPELSKRVVAVEPVDHPSDGQIIAYAKQHFKMAPPRIVTGTAG